MQQHPQVPLCVRLDGVWHVVDFVNNVTVCGTIVPSRARKLITQPTPDETCDTCRGRPKRLKRR